MFLFPVNINLVITETEVPMQKKVLSGAVGPDGQNKNATDRLATGVLGLSSYLDTYLGTLWPNKSKTRQAGETRVWSYYVAASRNEGLCGKAHGWPGEHPSCMNLST